MSRRTGIAAALTLASTVASALLLTGCGDTEGPARTPVGPPSARSEAAPTGGSPFWVDPDSEAARQVRRYEAEGRTEDAKLLKRIAEQPVADWPAGDDPVPDISKAVRGAAADKRTVVFVAYNIPHRDCGMYSAGGAHDAQAYRKWIDSFASAIGDATAIVVLEPDAVPHVADDCTPAQYHDERYELLSGAVDRLKRQPNTRVYLDAGNPRWIDDPGKLVEPLRRAGIAKADGFSLNVSNFETNDRVKGFGAQLSGMLGGAHFTIDTSRNGDGPAPGQGEDAWCNPPGRALGVPPTDRTGDELVDAYLWIKRPGESDGTCRGGPSAGIWWPDYALGLARRARA